MNKDHDIVKELRAWGNVGMDNVVDRAADTIERLRAERDEARREVSFLRPSVCLGAQTAQEYAEARGWECFKEDGK